MPYLTFSFHSHAGITSCQLYDVYRSAYHYSQNYFYITNYQISKSVIMLVLKYELGIIPVSASVKYDHFWLALSF